MNKSYLSIGAIFKNESHILQEWISHYLFHGIDHFYLLNDKSNDGYMKILQPYINKDIVTLYELEDEPKYNGRQGVLYKRYFMDLIKNKITKWLMIVDLDEFVYSPQQINIKNVLRKYEDYALIEMDWVIFGSNCHIKQPKNVIESFTKKAEDYKIKGFKQICNSDFIITEIGVHEHHAMGPTINISLKSGTQSREIREQLRSDKFPELVINHYQCQSLEFWTSIKMTRGDADSNLKDDGRTLQLFKEQDINDIEDVQLWNQNKEIKNTIIPEIITNKNNINDIEYKNKLKPNNYYSLWKPNIKSLEKTLEELIYELRDVLSTKIFVEIDFIYDKSIITDLIRNKWNGFLSTTNMEEYKKNVDIINSRYSKVKLNLIEGNIPLNNSDILSLINNCELAFNIWKILPDTYYHLQNPKIAIIEVNNNINILSQQDGSFISIIKIGLEKRYIPVLFTEKYLIFIMNECINKIKDKIKISKNPYDYLYLYNNVYIKNNTLYTNEQLIYNTAIRNWYLFSKKLEIDENWIINNINQFGYQIFNF